MTVSYVVNNHITIGPNIIFPRKAGIFRNSCMDKLHKAALGLDLPCAKMAILPIEGSANKEGPSLQIVTESAKIRKECLEQLLAKVAIMLESITCLPIDITVVEERGVVLIPDAKCDGAKCTSNRRVKTASTKNVSARMTSSMLNVGRVLVTVLRQLFNLN